jgi:ribosomal protein L11 methyltransferase
VFPPPFDMAKGLSWLEVSLTVDGEMAEAVAEVLSRYAANGVVIESTQIVPNGESEGQPTGSWRVCGYLPVDESLEGKRQRLEESLWYLGRIRPLPDPEFRQVQEEDWTESWKGHYRPIEIGKRLLILPAWMEAPETDRTILRIEPGMAFGTGTHPSTQLCLEIMDDFYADRAGPQENMIDIGCGSGILAVAGLKMGASYALGVDRDPQVLEIAWENAVNNQVSDRLEIGHGSVSEILSGRFSIKEARLVVANILVPVLVRLLGDGLGELLLPGGRLVLSGILEEQAGEVVLAGEEQGLKLVEKRHREDWVALVWGK